MVVDGTFKRTIPVARNRYPLRDQHAKRTRRPGGGDAINVVTSKTPFTQPIGKSDTAEMGRLQLLIMSLWGRPGLWAIRARWRGL
jgi:hypothetical protein